MYWNEKNALNWITKEQFLYLARVDLDYRAREAHLGKSVANLSGDGEARLELGNLVQDAKNYFSDYSLVLKDNKLLAI